MPARRFDISDLRAVLAALPSDRTNMDSLVVAARESGPVARSRVVAVTAEARESGEVEFYRHPGADDTLICFTPLGAARAGVRLSSDSTVWLSLDARTPVRYRVPADLLDLDGLGWNSVDRREPPPLDRVIAFEQDDGGAGEPDTKVNASVVVIGLADGMPLPPDPPPPMECPAHYGRLPRGREYCVRCDSTSVPAPPAKRPRAARLSR